MSALFEAYGSWSGDKYTTQPDFNDRLRAKGYESKRSKLGYFWHGIALTDADPEIKKGEPG